MAEKGRDKNRISGLPYHGLRRTMFVPRTGLSSRFFGPRRLRAKANFVSGGTKVKLNAKCDERDREAKVV